MQTHFEILSTIIAQPLRNASVAGAVFLLLTILPVPANAAPAFAPRGTCSGTATTICIDPATQTISQLQTTTANIRIDNVTNLYGADVVLTYDRSALCASDASHTCPNNAAVQLTPGPLLTSSYYFILYNSADNSTGTITFTLTQLNPALPVTGSGVLATITFVGLPGYTQSQIHFTYSKLSDRNGIQIPATTQDGVINISTPTAVTLSSFQAVQVEAAWWTGNYGTVLWLLLGLSGTVGVWLSKRRKTAR